MVQATSTVKMLCDNVFVLCSVLLWIAIVTKCADAVKSQELRPPAPDFSRHSIVHPVVLHGRTKREIFTTRDTNGGHHSEVTMKVPIDGEEFVLDLRLNHDLVTVNHVLSYQNNGKTVVHTPKEEELDLCHYGGSVRDKPGSWVAVSTCHGVQGIVFDGERMRYIEPAQEGGVTSRHYVYAGSDLTKALPPGFSAGITNSSHDDPEKVKTRHKRYASSNSQVRMPYNLNEQSRYVELVLVADRGMYEENNRDVRAVHQQMKTIANIIYSLYSPLNIFIALVGVEVWTDYDKIQMDENADTTLANFLKYRSSDLIKRIPNDNAHLITSLNFYDGIIGKAHRGQMCTLEQSGGIASYYTDVMGLLAMTVAHEMGHNLGMQHDEEFEECECNDEHCIMSYKSSNRLISVWSTCSLNNLAYSFSKGTDYCLRNKPERLYFGSPTCGNGFVEPGEQCDCGTMAVAGAYNPCHACCDPNTCMLRANATCGAGMCCDLQSCRPKSAGTLCRSAIRECDLPEFCTGHSEYCPDDVYKMDTTPCGRGRQSAYCVHGECRSHTQQCRLLWGVTGNSSHDKCYSHNTEGNEYGDCGYDRITGRYKACDTRDVMCGRLQCNHLSVSKEDVHRLEIGNGYTYTSSYKDSDTVGPCYTVSIDLGVKDLGLVPDGAKCGDEMMCLNQRCVSVAAVRQSSACPSNCSGHGVCDSAGNCHCEQGYDPPLCTLRRRTHTDNRGNYPFNYNKPVITTTTHKTRIKTKSSTCPSKCSGHGVCDFAGNCHCERGYAPPFCTRRRRTLTINRGYNGFNNNNPVRPTTHKNTIKTKQSIQIDPDMDTSSTDSSNWMVAIYVILGIIPLILLTMCLMYYFRRYLFTQYKDFQRKLSIKSNPPARRNSTIYKPSDPVHYVNAADIQSTIKYTNIKQIKSQETIRTDDIPEEVVQKILAANDIRNIYNSNTQVTYAKVFKPKTSPPPPPVTPKLNCLEVLKENIPKTAVVKGIEWKTTPTAGVQHRIYSNGNTNLYTNLAKQNVNYCP